MQRLVCAQPITIDNRHSTALHHRDPLEPHLSIDKINGAGYQGIAPPVWRAPLRTALLMASLAAGLGIPQAPKGAPLDLADAPLFLGFAAPPNLFFLIDDSGSMDWEVITRDFSRNQTFTNDQPDGTSVAGAGPAKQRGTCTFSSGTFRTTGGYIYGVQFPSNTYPRRGSNICDIAADEAWRFRNADFNVLYYNPNLTYAPWPGVDVNGNPFGDIDIHRAPDEPYDPQAFVDLTAQDGLLNSSSSGFRYYDWNDNGDGIFANGEQVEHIVKNEDAASQQNFANWFSYYRKREYVAKAAYGQLIARNQGKRMGMATLHDNNGVKTEIELMNVDPATGNKRVLMDNLYRIGSNRSTPLRRAMHDAGRYLECTGNPLFPTCPVLAEDEGGACQQNFLVAMTDGFYNGRFNFPGQANKDGDGDTAFDGGAHADARSDTVADIGMHYYERDLHPAIANAVVAIKNVDEATHQHVSTYGVAFGVEGSLSAMPPNRTDPFTWPDPFQSNVAARNMARVDDLRHAAYNGRGGFLSAQSPQELISALNRAFADVADRTGAAAAVAVNTTTLTTDTHVYQGRFDSGDWSGELLALPVGLDGTIGAPAWDAGEIINSQAFDARTIITYSTDPTVRDGVPFRWVPAPPPGTTTGISALQQAALNVNPGTGSDDGDGEDRLNFLRGDRSNEGTKFRTRSSVLGDIVHSAPFFVGVPPFFYPDTLETASYSSFVQANQGRPPTVYVGANDIGLHGFNADTGAEVIAYVPSNYANLSNLTDPTYAHRYYVDGEISVVDAFVNGAWMSVLVGALGRGGQGIYALDVTDPGRFTEGNADNLVLFEFTDADDPELGYTYGRPTVVKMANGKWAVVFGNGYNNTDSDGLATTSTTGHAVLYIAFIEAGLDGSWDVGDFIKLDTLVGDPATPNGLATPAAIDFNGDEVIDHIFAGDQQGNLWKFDVSDPNPGNWKIAYGGATPQPLFTALDPTGIPQPITTRPDVALHPAGFLGFAVYFTTGKYIETGDNNFIGEPTQSVYGIWDKNEATLLLFDRGHLLQQQILAEFDAEFDTDGDGNPDTTETVRTVSDNPINWHIESGNPTGTPPTTHLGWYMDLLNCDAAPDGVCTNTDNRGERAVTNPLLRTGRLIFTTLIPSADPCDFGGSGFIMEIDTNTGGQLAFSVFDFNNDLFFTTADYVQVTYDVNADGVVDVNDRIPASGVGLEGIPSSPVAVAGADVGEAEVKLVTLSTGVVKPVRNNPGPGQEGRQSWRRLR